MSGQKCTHHKCGVHVTVSSMVDSQVHNEHHVEAEHKQHQHPHQNLSVW